MIGEWQASIAHPAMSDWVTVAAYLIAVLASAFASRKAGERHQHREHSIWRIIALLMLALAINELLDLQSLVTIAGRASAHANGWYTERRTVQLVFVIVWGATVVSVGCVIFLAARNTHPAVRLALVGVALLGLFMFLRAPSIHHLDGIYARVAAWFGWAAFDEVAGFLVVTIAATLYIVKPCSD